MVFEKFIFSEKGRKLTYEFKEIFGGFFGYEEPGDRLIYATNDENDKVFEIPSWETPDDFKDVIQRSIKEKKNLLIQRYKEYIIEYDPDVDY